MKHFDSFTHCLLLFSASLSFACGGEGAGDIRFTIWGEEYIERGIPSDEFADGSSVRYETFLVVVGEVEVAGGDGPSQKLEGHRLYDLAEEGPFEVGSLQSLAAGAWREVSFSIAPADDDTERHASARSQDLATMVDNGYSLWARGTATTESGGTFTFDWGFATHVEYTDCVDVRDGQETSGLVVGDGTNDEHQLTIHGDHLFYDDLASAEAELRFGALAQADSDGDGHITLEELAQVRLASLPSEAGSYGVGAFDIDDLGAYLQAATHGVGHFDGEGHCTSRVR